MIGLDRLNKWSETRERTVALPSFLLSPLALLAHYLPACRSHRASINSTTSPPQPLSSRAYPFPLLYLTCSSGSQQTVKGQKAEAWEPGKYSNHCLSEEVRLVFHCQETEQGSIFGAGLIRFFSSSITIRIFTKTQPAFCLNVIKPHGWGNQWSVSSVSISFTNHTTHHWLWLFIFSPLWRAATRCLVITSAKKITLNVPFVFVCHLAADL